jgi:hypothetical protein
MQVQAALMHDVDFNHELMLMQAEWTCQAAAALHAVTLVIGGPFAAILNVKMFSKRGWSLSNADVAWAAFGQPLLTLVICGGLLATNLRLLQYAHLLA